MDSIFVLFSPLLFICAFALGCIVATVVYNRYIKRKRVIQHKRALLLAKSRIKDLVNAFMKGKYLGNMVSFQTMLNELISDFEAARNEGPTEFGVERAIRASGNAFMIQELLSANNNAGSGTDWITLSAFAATVNNTADLVQESASGSMSVTDKHIVDRARIHTNLDGKTAEDLTPGEVESYTLDILKQLTLLRCIQSLN